MRCGASERRRLIDVPTGRVSVANPWRRPLTLKRSLGSTAVDDPNLGLARGPARRSIALPLTNYVGLADKNLVKATTFGYVGRARWAQAFYFDGDLLLLGAAGWLLVAPSCRSPQLLAGRRHHA